VGDTLHLSSLSAFVNLLSYAFNMALFKWKKKNSPAPAPTFQEPAPNPEASPAREKKTLRLPVAEPGLRCAGSHYFEDAIAKVPYPGDVDVELVLRPQDDWQKVQVLYNGERIAGVNEQQDELLAVLRRAAPRGTRVVATARTHQENSFTIGGSASDWETRTRVTLMVPHPQRLDAWFRATPEERESMSLSENVQHKTVLKEQGKFQDGLRAAAAGRDEAIVMVDVVSVTEERGKYAGNPRLEFIFQGQAIGVLPGRYYDDEQALFDAVLNDGMASVQVEIRPSMSREGELYSHAIYSIPRK
jgi:hypothetical protein